MWRERRNVCRRWDVNGAPRRMVRTVRRGVVRRAVSVWERRSCCMYMLACRVSGRRAGRGRDEL